MRPRDLGTEDLDRWRAIQADEPSLDTPFLCPEYATAAEEIGRNVCVAVIEDGESRGYLPYEAHRYGVAAPVGGPLSDHQGAVMPRSAEWRLRDVLRGAGVRSWRFTSVPLWQLTGGAAPYVPHASPVIRLERGAEEYLGQRRRKHHAGTARSLRKLQREVGDVSFAAEIADPSALRTLMGWKSEQYRALETLDRFAVRWVVELVTALHRVGAPHFSGILSGIRVEGELIAAHFGMRSATTLHYWFPAYSPAYRSYSPGMILLMEMIRASEALRIARIDLGPGDEPYKRHLMNDSSRVARGRIEVPSPASAVLALAGRARAGALATPGIGRLARGAVRSARKARGHVPQPWRL